MFGIIRMYEYRFVPYILMTRDDVKPTDAIKISKQETMGYKGKMFGADILLGAVYLGAFLVFTLLGEIPYLGVLFRILWVLIAIAYGLLAPLFSGIMQAAFYVEIQNRRAAGSWHPAAPARPDWPTPPVQPRAAVRSRSARAAHPAHTARAVRCSRTACMPCLACCAAFVYRSCDAARFAGGAGRVLPGA